MQRKIGDLLAAPIIALWAVVVLPGWGAAERLMTANSMLFLIDGIIGLVVFCVTAVATFGALGIAAGLLLGVEAARIQALAVGCLSALGSLSMALAGVVPPTHGSPWLLSGWLLGLVGGPVVVALIVAGGELLPPPRRRHPAPKTLPSAPLASGPPSSTPAHPTPAHPTPAHPTPAHTTPAHTTPAPAPVTATSEDYWLQVANRPAPHPSELPDDPFWTDLSGLGWLLFGLCVGAIGLGVYWFGGRWHRGPHPIGGALLIAAAIGVGWVMDRARRHSRR